VRWCDVQIGDTVVAKTSRTACTLLDRKGRIYTWFILDSEDHDYAQRPGGIYAVEASAHEEEIEDWIVFT
jgi:hypothetical protein